MRRTVIVLGWLLCPASLPAAPVPTGQSQATGPATQAQLQAAAREYAKNLAQVIDVIQQYYVRQVSRAVLVEAALAGLHDAAQVPLPGPLRAEVKKMVTTADVEPLLFRARVGVGHREALQGRKALLASCRAVVRSLDPFCSVVTGEEAATPTGFDQNFGLGIDLVEKGGTGPLVIKAVVPGGPAQRAGLQAGDHISRVAGKDTQALSTEQALRLLNGGLVWPDELPPPVPPPPGAPPATNADGAPGPVRLTVRGSGGREGRDVTLVRGPYEAETIQGVTRAADNTWDYWVDRKKGIAHVRIAYLAEHTAGELGRVLARLDGDGLRGLLLDLRWCPGGHLLSATAAAGLFVEDGVIARTEIRVEGEHVYRTAVGDEPKFLRLPMVVLVNAETSGGAELIAAALQDHRRAAVAGQRTRGKGSIQTPRPVPLFAEDGRIDGELHLKLTNGTFLRPNGKSLTRFADSKPSDDWGVKPEPSLEFRTSADLSRQLKEWWQQQSLRPGTSNKALPLDDPERDPQRQAALKSLRRLMAEKK